MQFFYLCLDNYYAKIAVKQMVCWLPRKLNFNFSPFLIFSKCHLALWHLDKSSPAKSVNVIFDDMFPFLTILLPVTAAGSTKMQLLPVFRDVIVIIIVAIIIVIITIFLVWHTSKKSFVTGKLICEWNFCRSSFLLKWQESSQIYARNISGKRVILLRLLLSYLSHHYWGRLEFS